MPTTIDIQGISRSRALRALVAEQLSQAFDGLRVPPLRARVIFTDENGPKGGDALRCAVTVKPPRAAVVHVEHLAATPRLAFDGALGKLERRLVRHREGVRAQRRR
ncbi:MAG: HPF/RaiA family ribosome-associated protein, partial [Candidatus Rokuibacteriota bacterium]